MPQDSRPNILIFMTDQQRGDTVPPYNRAITPNLDNFYKEAVSFRNTYCPSPHCCPSRATFFTGLYPSQHGVWNNVDVGNTLSKGLNDGIRLWSEDLKEAGYKLYFTGKWHISAEEGPRDRGWEVTYPEPSYSRPKGHRPHPDTHEWNYYIKGNICHEGKKRREGEIIRPGYPHYHQYGVKENPFNDTDKTNNAIQSILSRKDDHRPWCHFIGTLGPHDPYLVPQKFLDMYDLNDIELPECFYDRMVDKPAIYRRTRDCYSQLTELEHRKSIQHYLAFCTYEDYLFGKVLKALEETGQLDNTVIIYTSDHGDYMGEHGLWAKGLPCFNSAYHVPLLIRWPGVVVNPGRSVSEFVSLADIAPTILEIAGIKADREFAGISLVPFLKNEEQKSWREAIYTQTNGNELYGIQRSVMTKEWKYVYNGFDYDELYNLKDDPEQMHNLINEPKYRHVVREMCKMMWEFAYYHGDVCINPYIAVAHAPYGPGIIFEKQEL